jgi:hypothetical protein
MSHFRRRLFARHQRGRRRRSRLGQLPLRQQNNLLRGLIARRARIVHDDRVRALETARHEAEAKSPSVEAIVNFSDRFCAGSLAVIAAGGKAASPRSSTCCT